MRGTHTHMARWMAPSKCEYVKNMSVFFEWMNHGILGTAFFEAGDGLASKPPVLTHLNSFSLTCLRRASRCFLKVNLFLARGFACQAARCLGEFNPELCPARLVVKAAIALEAAIAALVVGFFLYYRNLVYYFKWEAGTG